MWGLRGWDFEASTEGVYLEGLGLATWLSQHGLACAPSGGRGKASAFLWQGPPEGPVG